LCIFLARDFLFEVPNQIWALTLAAAQARTLAANGAQQEDMHGAYGGRVVPDNDPSPRVGR
jgi:hypothetical protein